MRDLQIKNQMIIPKFIDWKINSALKKRSAYKGINPADSICFIANVEDKPSRELLLKYSDDLKKRHKKVVVLFFFDGTRKRLEKRHPNITDLNVVTRSDFSLFAGVSDKKYQSQIQESFDLLCNFDTSKSKLPHLLSAQSMAKFKIGIDLEQTEIYDLFIDRTDSPSVKQLINDLKEVMNSVFSHQLSKS